MKLKIEDHPTAKQYLQKKSTKDSLAPPILDGAWLHQIALDQEEKEEGIFLACQARATEPVVIDA